MEFRFRFRIKHIEIQQAIETATRFWNDVAVPLIDSFFGEKFKDEWDKAFERGDMVRGPAWEAQSARQAPVSPTQNEEWRRPRCAIQTGNSGVGVEEGMYAVACERCGPGPCRVPT